VAVHTRMASHNLEEESTPFILPRRRLGRIYFAFAAAIRASF
jgi:hypothetical protein